MGRHQKLIAAACVTISLFTSAIATPATSTSSTTAAKYKAAAELFKGTLDLRELELRVTKERLVDKDETIAAWKNVALERPVRVEEKTSSWVWPAIAGALVAGFTGGFLLATIDR